MHRHDNNPGARSLGRKIFDGTVAVAMIAALLFLFTVVTPTPAEADEPVTVVTVITVSAAVTTIITGAIWLFDRIFGGDEKVCTTTTVTTTTTYEDGTTETETETTTSYSRSPAKITIPDDFPGLKIPAGVELEETTYFNGRDDGTLEMAYQNLYLHGNVLDERLTNVTQVEYDVDRETVFRLVRPASAEGEASTLTLPIGAEGVDLSTTSVPDTAGRSRWDWTVEIRQLGKVFQSSVIVPQDGIPIVSGDIPASAFKLSEGRAELTKYDSELTIDVPPHIDALDFTISYSTEGVGAKTDADATTASETTEVELRPAA